MEEININLYIIGSLRCFLIDDEVINKLCIKLLTSPDTINNDYGFLGAPGLLVGLSTI